MMNMLKIAVLLLVAFMATAHEVDSNHELHPYSSSAPSPLPYPPPSSPSSSLILAPYAAQEVSRADCLKKCHTGCTQSDSFVRKICVNICTAKCPKASLDDISCILDCAQSSTNSLRYDASMVEDLASSCYKECKKE